MKRFDHRTPRLALTSAACLILTVALFAIEPGTGVHKILGNGSPIHWVLVIIFSSSGIFSHLIYRNTRIELEGTRIQRFDFLNRKFFEANLDDFQLTLDRSPYAHLVNSTSKFSIRKSIRDYGDLLKRLQGHPTTPLPNFETKATFPVKPIAVIPIFATYFTLAAFISVTLKSTQIAPFCLWFGMGAIMFALPSWLYCKNSRIEIAPDGLKVFNLFNQVTVDVGSDEIVDAQIIKGEGDAPDVFWIYSVTDSIRIRTSIKDFDGLASLVNALLNQRQAALAQFAAEKHVEIR